MAVLRFIYALYLRLTGAFLLAVGGGLLTLNYLVVPLPNISIWAPFAISALGLFLLIPWWLPAGLRTPRQGRDIAWIAVHAVAAVLHQMTFPFAVFILIPFVVAPIGQVLYFILELNPLLWLLLPSVLMLLLVLPSMKRSAPSDRPDPNDPARAIPVKEKKPAKIPEKKLPALGAAMKLYIAADWMMLRIMGLGLMATAYMLWVMIQDGRIFQAEILAHGKDPMTAVYVYGGVGALLGIPFLLPGRIARPRNVAFGLIKAILLVGAAYVLILPLDLAIVDFTPDIYHATLIETVPRLFKAICGVAVTSALLISFFRQLNGLPAMDYKGDPKVHLSQNQLHDLRKARMP